jgi:competence protein ComEC
MNWFIKWISDQEQFVFQHITFPFSLVILSYILLIVGYQLWENYTKKRSYRFLWTIIVLQIALIYQKQQRNSTQEVVIFNKSKASLLGLRDGRSIQTFHNMDSLEMEKSHIITSYTTHEGIRTLTEQPKLPSVFSYNNTSVLLVDSLGIYQNKYFKPEIIWLTSSPEINIERLLKTKKPSLILADASNYKSYVRHWKKVCQENQTCFYDTATQGAFVMR